MVHLVGYFGCAAISIVMMGVVFHALVWPTLQHRKKSVLNGNLVLDDDEPLSTVQAEHDGHETVRIYDLPYSKFDADNNRLPDWWEIATGLSQQPIHALTDDNDHDGLINLYALVKSRIRSIFGRAFTVTSIS